jgi:putative ABC transport system permease protein
MLALKDRKYEIGVLLSIGEKKLKIILQLVLEIIIPVIIAFSISIATGAIASQQIGNIMLQTENQVQQNISADTTVTDYMTGKTISTKDKIDVKVSGENSN